MTYISTKVVQRPKSQVRGYTHHLSYHGNYKYLQLFSFLGILLFTFLTSVPNVCADEYTQQSKSKSADERRTRWALDERLAYNTEKQLSAILTGVYGFSPEVFAVASLQYGLYRTSIPPTVERTYGGAVQAGYNNGLWGIDGSYYRSASYISLLTTQGFGVGATFAYMPSFFDGSGSDSRMDLMKVSNRQTYQTRMEGEEEKPLFWARIGVISNSFSSRLLAGGSPTSRDGINQLGVSVDAYYPVDGFSVLSAGFSSYGYNKDPATFANDLFRNDNERVFLIGSTVLGLPTMTAYVEFSWQVTPRDAFMPRVSTGMLNATKQWEVGGALTWRRQVTKGLFFTPSYELTVLGSTKVSGVVVSFFQEFM